eukprot:2206766-Amphidinium_carterae.2
MVRECATETTTHVVNSVSSRTEFVVSSCSTLGSQRLRESNVLETTLTFPPAKTEIYAAACLARHDVLRRVSYTRVFACTGIPPSQMASSSIAHHRCLRWKAARLERWEVRMHMRRIVRHVETYLEVIKSLVRACIVLFALTDPSGPARAVSPGPRRRLERGLLQAFATAAGIASSLIPCTRSSLSPPFRAIRFSRVEAFKTQR